MAHEGAAHVSGSGVQVDVGSFPLPVPAQPASCRDAARKRILAMQQRRDEQRAAQDVPAQIDLPRDESTSDSPTATWIFTRGASSSAVRTRWGFFSRGLDCLMLQVSGPRADSFADKVFDSATRTFKVLALPPEQQREVANQTEKLEGAAPVLPPIISPSARPGRVPEAVPGAIFRATVDRTTPLTYGYEDPTLPVLLDSAFFFRPSKEGTNAVVFAADDRPLRLSGFIWPNNTERLLRGTAYVIEEPTGRGHVVLFAEDPNFRAIFRSTTRLFFNSFLFQPTF